MGRPEADVKGVWGGAAPHVHGEVWGGAGRPPKIVQRFHLGLNQIGNAVAFGGTVVTRRSLEAHLGFIRKTFFDISLHWCALAT